MNHLQHLNSNVQKSTVEIVAHSRDPQGNELISAILTYPLFIHAELMTHRMFSRNAASARAIPGKVYRDTIEHNLVLPYALQKKHSGMQGGEYLDEEAYESAITVWKQAFLDAKNAAAYLDGTHEVTKQITNRLLSPFAWMRVLVTTSDVGLGNFFHLRCHKDAEIHIMELANNWKDALAYSVPKQLKPGEWHIPFQEKIEELLSEEIVDLPEDVKQQLILEVATGMAARTSYTLMSEDKDWSTYKRVHDKMLVMEPFHASPFEHSAQCLGSDEYFTYGHLKGFDKEGKQLIEYGWVANFRGFKSYRYIVEQENKQQKPWA